MAIEASLELLQEAFEQLSGMIVCFCDEEQAAVIDLVVNEINDAPVAALVRGYICSLEIRANDSANAAVWCIVSGVLL